MKEFSVGYRCDFCGQKIAHLLPDSPEEAFGALFQERTFLEVRLALTQNPSQWIAEYRYCSDYCAREDLDLRISRRNEQMRHFREANTLSFWRAQPRGATGKDRA